MNGRSLVALASSALIFASVARAQAQATLRPVGPRPGGDARPVLRDCVGVGEVQPTDAISGAGPVAFTGLVRNPFAAPIAPGTIEAILLVEGRVVASARNTLAIATTPQDRVDPGAWLPVRYDPGAWRGDVRYALRAVPGGPSVCTLPEPIRLVSEHVLNTVRITSATLIDCATSESRLCPNTAAEPLGCPRNTRAQRTLSLDPVRIGAIRLGFSLQFNVSVVNSGAFEVAPGMFVEARGREATCTAAALSNALGEVNVSCELGGWPPGYDRPIDVAIVQRAPAAGTVCPSRVALSSGRVLRIASTLQHRFVMAR